MGHPLLQARSLPSFFQQLTFLRSRSQSILGDARGGGGGTEGKYIHSNFNSVAVKSKAKILLTILKISHTKYTIFLLKAWTKHTIFLSGRGY